MAVRRCSVRRGHLADRGGCVSVLARLPGYFTPNTHDELREQYAAGEAWVAVDDEGGDVVGFVLVTRRPPGAAEITFAAVSPERRHGGIGTALVEGALAVLGADGVAVVEVKTLDASAGYAPYEATRAFWAARGFVQIDCIDPMPGWPPGNPAAICAAALRPTRPPARPGWSGR